MNPHCGLFSFVIFLLSDVLSYFFDHRSEVSQVSVGPTGMTWAVTWHGKALVRLGVTRLDPTGETSKQSYWNCLTYIGQEKLWPDPSSVTLLCPKPKIPTFTERVIHQKRHKLYQFHIYNPSLKIINVYYFLEYGKSDFTSKICTPIALCTCVTKRPTPSPK